MTTPQIAAAVDLAITYGVDDAGLQLARHADPPSGPITRFAAIVRSGCNVSD